MACVVLIIGASIFFKMEVPTGSHIVEIEQYSLQKEALSTLYLAELLELCVDKPIEYDAFDMEVAKKKLLSSSDTVESHLVACSI